MSKCDSCELRKIYAKYFDMHWMGKDDCPVECTAELEFGESYTSTTYTITQEGPVGMSQVNVHYPIIDKYIY